MNYAIVFVTDGLMSIDVDGVVTEVSMRAGDAYSRPAGIRHDVKNAGTAPMSFVEVEMK
jgi:mannose-6-phosphate isomerase-like protein (cupin superfamily)